MSRRIGMVVPDRYESYFRVITVDSGPTVMTSVGPRRSIGYRWECRHCGTVIKPNSAGAQSHIAKHVRCAKEG